ncbi:PD-(D/E)XK nuclease family protein [Streptomyces clavuligerus]|uniref:PD-(D/E)XK endonuclease-like domain-containing protein n=1 Tax=Streptomyces clavuligerus TaxID=1901 RepID=B5GWS4_STRCL|nr:PD-(D/E)XK nuclease family protein [Streptomyces clavuligerus]ANW16929.1 hypothetical protein BB341_01140 [Streptomyces clavuligerus]AXU11458.1 PD-(D/E)XK nuclease family protein [Streptomyces clavuligerus]EDY50770.1 hypothetical protein SSCG_03450 [Streptomyces clavuligerus]EFG10547.1 Hypothetical protein SCLAV_5480 [Streptomyces clavuligerus]MBY6301276.1 PD-(D/E)XK nuclease family protein [Streptomyces clavuligerus]
MSNWPRTLATSDELSLIRTGLPLTREDPDDCPAHLAVRARPWLTAAYSMPSYEPFLTFALKPLMTALDRIEFDGCTAQEAVAQLRRTRGAFGKGRPAHDGLIEWTAQALTRYLDRWEARQRTRGAHQPPMRPVAEEWVVRNPLPRHAGCDARGAWIYERTAWGRRYASADGSVRELWLLSFGTAKKDRPVSEVGAAALVTAFGEPCRSGYDRARGRTEPYTPVVPFEAMPEPERIRVVDFGCGDGGAEITMDCTPAEARRAFDRDTAPVLGRVVDGAERRPGRSCAECPGAGRCSALPGPASGTAHGGNDQQKAAPVPAGLIGLPRSGPVRKRRSLSASDLRAYADCPAKYHLTRELKLRSLRPENEAIRRGRAVDSLLNIRHELRRPRGCRGLPAPDAAVWAGLPEDAARAAGAMVEQHATLCPLDRLGPEERVRVQPQVTAYDPLLDIVLIARPDLLHTRRGGWVWRETKTRGGRLYEGGSVLKAEPQLALAVLLMRTGELADGDRRRSRIELELLRTETSNRLEIDPWQPEVYTEALAVVRAMAEPWSRDTVYRTAPTRHCHGCEALDWCREGRAHLAAETAATPQASQEARP